MASSRPVRSLRHVAAGWINDDQALSVMISVIDRRHVADDITELTSSSDSLVATRERLA